MPDPHEPSPPDAPNDSRDGATDEAANENAVEAENPRRLFDVWRLLPGNFPWLTASFVLISAVVFALGHVIPPERVYDFLYATGFALWVLRKWSALITSVFIHGDVLHLLFNCYWIWIFGRLLERELGVMRYLGLFLAGAWIGGAAQLAWSGDLGIGLSGVAYAYFGFLLVNRRHHPDFAAILPIGTVQILIAWLVLCFPLTRLGVLHVANFAHLGGLVAGSLVGLATYPHPWRRRAWVMGFALGVLSFVPLLWAPWQESWLLAQAYQMLQSNADDEQALAALEKVRAKNPENIRVLETEVQIWSRQSRFAEARNALDRALERSEEPELRNALAWLLATCPAAEIRDGARAVVLARRACESDGWKTASYIDTLAAACAEIGDFKEAEKWMLKALAENPGNEAGVLREHLAAFRAGKAWREPPPAKAP